MANKTNFNFNFGEGTVSNGRNQIRFTAQLNAVADQRAQEALRAASQDQKLFDMANAAFDSGDAAQLFNFLETTVGNNIATDAEMLDGATEKEFDSMLESRRSDRSKTKKKGLKSSAAVALKYLSCGYAEMLVRTAWNKPYDATQSTIDVDTEDLDAINRKIKSLQSKKSRLNKLVELGDEVAHQQYDEVVSEIDRLQQFRPSTRSTVKAVIKDVDTDTLRTALSNVDTSMLDDETASKLAELMKKLG